MANAPIHVGLLARDFLKWGGGVWFIQNLLRGLATVPTSELRLTVLAPVEKGLGVRARRLAGRTKRALLTPSRAYAILVGSRAAERALEVRGIDQLASIVPTVAEFDGSDFDLMRRCAALGIDVLIPVMTPLLDAPIPWVGYLYDCQHRHYPQFFDAAEIARRDKAFATMLERAPIVFANARDVIDDLKTFFPEGRSRLFSLPFAPLILEDELAQAARDAPAARQSVTSGAPYFIVCNQFWVHKDHATAFRAFALFSSTPERREWRLICTGMTEDYRMPQYFERLKALVRELNIEERVIFTGYIDRALQQPLLFGAAALIQPTLFEGGPGGGAVSDAVALGVPSLVSDIPVNLELAEPLATHFRAGDPASLAAAMDDVVRRPPVRPQTSILAEQSHQRARELGAALSELVRCAMAVGTAPLAATNSTDAALQAMPTPSPESRPCRS